MIIQKLVGWLYIVAGLFFIIFFAGQLLLQLGALILGIMLVVYGIKRVSFSSGQARFFSIRYLYDRWFHS